MFEQSECDYLRLNEHVIYIVYFVGNFKLEYMIKNALEMCKLLSSHKQSMV
jgi:hypothetical protein